MKFKAKFTKHFWNIFFSIFFISIFVSLVVISENLGTTNSRLCILSHEICPNYLLIEDSHRQSSIERR